MPRNTVLQGVPSAATAGRAGHWSGRVPSLSGMWSRRLCYCCPESSTALSTRAVHLQSGQLRVNGIAAGLHSGAARVLIAHGGKRRPPIIRSPTTPCPRDRWPLSLWPMARLVSRQCAASPSTKGGPAVSPPGRRGFGLDRILLSTTAISPMQTKPMPSTWRPHKIRSPTRRAGQMVAVMLAPFASATRSGCGKRRWPGRWRRWHRSG
jgi:hypothetical protein